MKAVVILSVALLAASPALAWGNRGHRAIADIAWTQLTPIAQRGVTELLANSPALATPACPVGSLEDAATWADCVRSQYHDRFADTSSWHYMDASICHAFTVPVDAGARFVVARYRRERAILRDRAQPSEARLEALLWVTHLVGDLQQPLHIGDAGDRGGNEVAVAGGQGRYPLNLHAEWDSVLVDDVVRDQPDGVAAMAAIAADRAISDGWHSTDPVEWARESWGLARTVAYPPGLPGSGCNDAGMTVSLGADYRRRAVPAVALQLEKAGVRLADVLNGSFATGR